MPRLADRIKHVSIREALKEFVEGGGLLTEAEADTIPYGNKLEMALTLIEIELEDNEDS